MPESDYSSHPTQQPRPNGIAESRSPFARLPLASRDRSFVLLLTPIVAASVPSFLFCTLALALWMHSVPGSPITLHLPPQSLWDHLFSLELSVYQWVARWNSAITRAATAFFASTLLLPRWRHYAVVALIPYGLLLCADFTLRWL